MKLQYLAVLFVSLFLTGTVLAAIIPDLLTLHQMCNQNTVCAEGTYCRISGDPNYGTCEDPKHV